MTIQQNPPQGAPPLGATTPDVTIPKPTPLSLSATIKKSFSLPPIALFHCDFSLSLRRILKVLSLQGVFTELEPAPNQPFLLAKLFSFLATRGSVVSAAGTIHKKNDAAPPAAAPVCSDEGLSFSIPLFSLSPSQRVDVLLSRLVEPAILDA